MTEAYAELIPAKASSAKNFKPRKKVQGAIAAIKAARQESVIA